MSRRVPPLDAVVHRGNPGIRLRAIAAAGFLLVWALGAGLTSDSFRTEGALTPDSAPGRALEGAGKAFAGILFLSAIGASAGIAWFLVRVLVVWWKRRKADKLAEHRESPRNRGGVFVVLLIALVGLVVGLGWAVSRHVLALPSFEVPAPVVSGAAPHSVSQAERSSTAIPVRGVGNPRWLLPSGLALAAALVMGAALIWRPSRRDSAGESDAKQSELERGSADSGEPPAFLGSGNTILECYGEMCVLLGTRLRIQRAMTPREFVERIRESGFPATHAEALTDLFERVRYGHEDPGEHERTRALEALHVIREQLKKTHK